MLEPLGEAALAAAHPTAGECAVDIGCGCGATTIALAERVTPGGRVLGVDISEPMLARAQERCAALGLANVELLQADAQRAVIPRGHDLAFSRFGIMFFEDPVAAIDNIGRALRKDGRLAFVCWQERARNPWMGIPMAAALQHVPPPPPIPPDAPGPFAFADRDRVARILGDAGFADVAVRSFEHDLLVGGASNLDDAAAFAVDSGSVRTLLRDADEATHRRAAESIRAAFEPYVGSDGVRIAAAAWVVTARRAAA
jgi:SAM-dependent methyltransferase